MAQRDQNSGLLSPAPSENSTFIPSTDLPIPRSHPLMPGSAKETALINYLDSRITYVTGRYAKSFAATSSDRGPDSGYTSFDQVIQDIDPIVDVVWITSTPSIQVPYLLTLAGLFSDYLPAFPFIVSTLRLTRKFDLAFSSLLSHSSSQSNRINPTDKVRIRSLVEESKLNIINVASRGGHKVLEREESEDEEDETTTDLESSTDDASHFTSPNAVAAELGKVYERTIQILGGDISSLPRFASKPEPPALQLGDEVEVIEL